MQSYLLVKIDKPLVCGILFFMKKKVINKGDKYGYLEIVKEVEPLKLKDGRFRRKFELKCVCGNTVYRTLKNIEVLPHGNCGCKKSEFQYKTHGMTNTRIYDIWVNMKQRCYNEKKEEYARYGGRGVIVCDRWLNSFENFYSDVKDGYSDELTIDRYPNKNGNYEPENFRWATDPEQQNNKNNNVYYKYNGEQKTLAEIAKMIGVDHRKLWARVKSGMTAQCAADLGNNKKKHPIRKDSLRLRCEKLGINYNAVKIRKSKFKITEEEAIKYYIK